ncbi:MAG: hypothetical protein IJP99_01515 [Methanobrevibacter sp.]|nr:hypothetical protein [Methanobrevibacter sp.]
MNKENPSPIVFNEFELYNLFFNDGTCIISLDFPMVFIYFLDQIARNEDKIILINSIQENMLFEDGFKCNGTVELCLDNLKHIYCQKYIKKVDDYYITETTNLDSFINKNCKYSNFLSDLIVKIMSIEQISYEKISEIIKVFLNVKIDRKRIYDLFNRKIDEYIHMNIKDLQEEILNGNIEFSGVIHYDEEYLWIKHQPYVRLTILDAENKLIIEDTVIPRDIFTKDYIKTFLETSLNNLEVKTIITDGYKAYTSIIDDLGYNHQRCTFHSMKNLMDDIIPKHNILNRKIKKLNKDIPELEKEINKIKEKYKGKKGRTSKEDTQRNKDNKKRKQLEKELRDKKAQRRKYTKRLKEDDKIVKKISLIFKSKTYKTAKNRFQRLYDKINELPEEIQKYLKRLEKYLEKTLQHSLNQKIPSTNNLIEGFYKTTLPGCIKKIFKTYRGLLIRITLNNIRWIKRCATINEN